MDGEMDHEKSFQKHPECTCEAREGVEGVKHWCKGNKGKNLWDWFTRHDVGNNVCTKFQHDNVTSVGWMQDYVFGNW